MDKNRETAKSKRSLWAALGAMMFALGLFALVGCDMTGAVSNPTGTQGSAGSGEAEQEDTTITVAATPLPHADILNSAVAPLLEEEGYTLVVEEYNDYVLPNSVTDSGEADANFFQHAPFLEQFNNDEGTDLVEVASVHIEPMSLYAGSVSSLDEVSEGATVAIPNDVTNSARALQLLEQADLIELAAGVGEDATVDDIVDNPLGLEILQAEASTLPALLDSVELVAINTNYALEADLSDNQVLQTEDADPTYANVLVVKDGNEDLPKIQALVDALTSDEVVEYIEDTYTNEVVPVG